MTVFKYFFKVMKEYKATIILYTVLLVGFAGFNLETSDNSTNFMASKPDILVIDNDNSKLSNNLENYLKDNANLKEIENDEEKINDALFYRDVSLVIEIPEGYGKSIIDGTKKELSIKSTGDKEAEYGKMLLERYLNVSNVYEEEKDEDKIVSKINENIKSNLSIKIESKLDTASLDKTTFFYNFANYSLLAGCIFVISTVLNSFKTNEIKKRTIVSSYNYKKYNKDLFKAGTVFGIILWSLYALISMILLSESMFTLHGILYLLNSFIFMICATQIAFLMGTLINNKEALNSIVNIIALGSSFLCGAFVPMQYLPGFVLKVAHILPSYWFIKNNEIIKELEEININTLESYFINIIVIIIFILVLSLITNMVSKKKRKIN